MPVVAEGQQAKRKRFRRPIAMSVAVAGMLAVSLFAVPLLHPVKLECWNHGFWAAAAPITAPIFSSGDRIILIPGIHALRFRGIYGAWIRMNQWTYVVVLRRTD